MCGACVERNGAKDSEQKDRVDDDASGGLGLGRRRSECSVWSVWERERWRKIASKTRVRQGAARRTSEAFGSEHGPAQYWDKSVSLWDVARGRAQRIVGCGKDKERSGSGRGVYAVC